MHGSLHFLHDDHSLLLVILYIIIFCISCIFDKHILHILQIRKAYTVLPLLLVIIYPAIFRILFAYLKSASTVPSAGTCLIFIPCLLPLYLFVIYLNFHKAWPLHQEKMWPLNFYWYLCFFGFAQWQLNIRNFSVVVIYISLALCMGESECSLPNSAKTFCLLTDS